MELGGLGEGLGNESGIERADSGTEGGFDWADRGTKGTEGCF